VRGKRPNERAHLRHTAECVARLRGLTFDELAALTTANAKRLFHLAR
jgi:TatD DNase family protein